MRHDIDLLTTAAGMRARGRSWVAVAEAVGRNERSCRRWAKLPEFKAEVERAQADLAPTPRGVYIAALTATKTDGIDWQARIRAADALADLDAKHAGVEDDDDDLGTGWT
jgi:hypothetical protein